MIVGRITVAVSEDGVNFAPHVINETDNSAPPQWFDRQVVVLAKNRFRYIQIHVYNSGTNENADFEIYELEVR